MESMITIIDRGGIKAVSARELHAFLGSKRDFSNWIKDRIEKYVFIENQDFELLNNFGEQTGRGGHNKIEYALSIDCAKEISMVEGNEKGKQARQYFIECEKQLRRSIENITRKELAQMILESEMENEKLRAENEAHQKAIAKLQPRSEFVDVVLSKDSLLTGSQVCKVLKLPFGNVTLYKKLREEGIFYRNKNEPKQRYVDADYVRLKEVMVKDSIILQPLFTQKGLGYVARIFNVIQIPHRMTAIRR